jgi:myo-inositol-1(or 4)-monophosphatase
MVPDITALLKETCYRVFKRTRGLVGTELGNERFEVGAGGDISRKIDLVAEAAVFEVLDEYNFRPTIIAEEAGIVDGHDGYMVVDAVDGTTNASRDIPFVCCSLAFSSGVTLSSVEAAAVIDLTNRDLYHAKYRMGSYKNDRAIRVSTSTPNSESHEFDDIIIGLNLSSVDPSSIMKLLKVVSKSKHIRQFGANALELCYLASGLLDAYIDLRGKIRITDVAAAYLVVKEAGGKLYATNGSELDSTLTSSERISFLAVRDERLFTHLASNIGSP